jgi:hypothetical protein
MSVNSQGNVYVSYLRDNGSSGNIFTDMDTDNLFFASVVNCGAVPSH